MKHRAPDLLTAVTLCLLTAGISLAAPQEVKISKSGVTTLRAVLGGKKVDITFRTIILRKSDPGFPLILKDGYNEASFVQEMTIVVDGKALAVPWDAYATLYNVRGAELTLEKGVFKLVTGGAHGADTYSVHIYFNAKRIIKLESYGAFSPYDRPGEVTIYSPPINM